MGIANKKTHERLQRILTDAKGQIRLSMEKIESKEESVVIPIEEDTDKKQENE